MQLRKLESYGFKSFADKIELEFGTGITAIVGPNGSGKSNITDAIRWALGEQNIRNLRGAKTEDIIFSGSKARRSSGVAEVSLVFDNSDGKLPLEYKEVVVTRRIFRSGESEFYINKVACRLKDIQNLFFDTGLGKDAMSVISQNKVDQILNSRPEERRLFFEEAAGITKYRNRQKESVRKLNDTEQNILRVEDILNELNLQSIPMKESAEKTEKFNTLQSSLKDCNIQLLIHEWMKNKKNLDALLLKKRTMQDKLENIADSILFCDVNKTKLENELLELNNQLNLLNERRQDITLQVEKNKNTVIIAQDRIKQIKIALSEIVDNRNKANLELDLSIEKSKKMEVDITRVTNSLVEIRNKIIIEERKKEEFSEIINKIEKKIYTEKEESLKKLSDLMVQKGKLNSLEQNIVISNEALAKTNQEKTKIIRLNEEGIFNCNFINVQIDTLESLRLKKEQSLVLLEEEQQKIKRELDSIDQKMKKSQSLIFESENRQNFLLSLQNDYDGFSKAVKKVLKSTLPWRKDICGVVAELIKVPANFIDAIDAALGGNMQNIIANNDEAVKGAISLLKKEKYGRATFLPLNLLQVPLQRRDFPVLQQDGVFGFAHQLISYDEKYRKAMEYLLGKTLVVDSMDTAIQIIRNVRIKVVTLDGEVVNPSGAISGGSNKQKEFNFLNRSNEIERLYKTIDKISLEVQKMKAEKEKLDWKNLEYIKEIVDLREKINTYYIKNETLKVNRQKSIDDIKDTAEKISRLEFEVQKTIEQKSVWDLERNSCKFEIGCLEREITSKEADSVELSQELSRLRNDCSIIDQNLMKLKIQCSCEEQELEIKKTAKFEYENNTTKYNQIIKTYIAKVAELENNQRGYLSEIQKNNQINAELILLEASIAKDYANYYQIKLDKLAEIQDNDKNSQKFRKEQSEMKEQFYKLDIDYTQSKYQIDACKEKLTNEYSVSETEWNHQDVSIDVNTVKTKINRLELKLKELGDINPHAIIEYNKLQGRYTFMKKQSEDLVMAKEYLLGIIKDMDIAMTKQFKIAFEAINGHFQNIYLRLFGGGQAKLILLEDNILESGIDIYVQPPEKKMRNLILLSGGERALTVIALLFAFLAFRPAPFTVLDEIDAALDEANLKRFSKFLEEYSDNTQFIIVTHRKSTMESADTMHGVTVNESGISKIISVKLEN